MRTSTNNSIVLQAHETMTIDRRREETRVYVQSEFEDYCSMDCPAEPPRMVGIGVDVIVDGFTPARIGFTETSAMNETVDGRASAFTYLSGVGTSSEVALSHGLFDSIDFRLVTFAILHGALFRFLQRLFERFNAIHRRLETFLELGQFTSKIGIFSNELRRKCTGDATFEPSEWCPTCL